MSRLEFIIIIIIIIVNMNTENYYQDIGARGSVVGWGTMIQAGRSPLDF
jgi:hypothetical protein